MADNKFQVKESGAVDVTERVAYSDGVCLLVGAKSIRRVEIWILVAEGTSV